MQIIDKKLILKKSLYYLFGFLPLIITLFIYPHIPKHVPSHYTAVGEIANWNSREQILIIPFLLAIFTYFKPKIFVENFKSKSSANFLSSLVKLPIIVADLNDVISSILTIFFAFINLSIFSVNPETVYALSNNSSASSQLIILLLFKIITYSIKFETSSIM